MEVTLMIGYGLAATFTLLGIIMIVVLVISNKKDRDSNVVLPSLEEDGSRGPYAPRKEPVKEAKKPLFSKGAALPEPRQARAPLTPRAALPDGGNAGSLPAASTPASPELPNPRVTSPEPSRAPQEPHRARRLPVSEQPAESVLPTVQRPEHTGRRVQPAGGATLPVAGSRQPATRPVERPLPDTSGQAPTPILRAPRPRAAQSNPDEPLTRRGRRAQ